MIKLKSIPNLTAKKHSKLHTGLYEVGFIVLFIGTLFYLLALISHSPSDDIWTHSNEVSEVINLGGSLGALLSEISFTWFGWGAFFIPIMLSFLIYHSYQNYAKHQTLNLSILFIRGLGFILLLVLISGFIINNTADEFGGWMGKMVNESLFTVFGHLVDVVYVGLIMISLSLTGHLSWFTMLDKTGRIIALGFNNIRAYFSHKRLLRQQKKQIKSANKEREKIVNSSINATHSAPVIKEKPSTIKQSVKANTGEQTALFSDKNTLPALSLLDPHIEHQSGYSQETLSVMSRQVEVKLKDFGFEVSIETVTPGPVITQFELSLAPGVKVAQIVNLSKDLARALLVESVRVVDVIPGKPVIGLEIPNTKREMISLKQMLSSEAFDTSKSALTVILGKDINGNPVVADLAKMPHLLVAGATGMGKSVGLNAMILSVMYKSTPKDVRMIMIDPKVVEMASYADIPHLLTPVITDMNEAAGALRWSVNEMERRYQLLAKFGVRNLEGLNNKIAKGIKSHEPLLDPFFDLATASEEQTADELEHLPLIVMIIDEYADMLGALAQEDKTKSKRVEALIIRLAQKARAAGIHLVIATQRPSVDVITGLIKSNIPSRIAFKVSSKIDSRTILDQGGAEQLLGMGDMLYMTTGQGQLQRIHGAFVSDDEVNRITQSLRDAANPDYLSEITNMPGEEDSNSSVSSSAGAGSGGEQDEMYDEAVQVVLETRRASISSLQRRLRIGYNRAARIIEDMEVAGIVSSMNSNGNREILAPNHDDPY